MIAREDLEDYLTRLEVLGRSPVTIKNYRVLLEPFIEYTLEHDLNPENCRELLEKYQLHLKREHRYSNGSLKTATTTIKLFLIKLGYPCHDVELPKTGKRHPKYLTREEVDKLLEAPSSIYQARDKAILSLLYTSGLRVSELTSLNKEDVNFQDGTITVKHGKGDRDRVTMTTPGTLQLLKDMMYKRTRKGREDKGPALFTNRYGNRLNSRSVQRIVKEASQEAGITKKVTPHILRHTFAVHSLEEGFIINDVQQLLGHSSLSSTQIYTEIRPRDIQERYKQLKRN
jgi:integrase/recombinase XerD